MEDPSDWLNCLECFSTIPYDLSDFTRPETWFSQEHSHDSAALVWGEYTANASLTDAATQLTGHRTGAFWNRLVNTHRAAAEERGLRYVLLNATSYNGTGEMRVQIMQAGWQMTAFWVNHLVTLNIGGAAALAHMLLNIKAEPNWTRIKKRTSATLATGCLMLVLEF